MFWKYYCLLVNLIPMKIRAFGFQIDKKKFPKALTPSDVFIAIEANAGAPLDKKELIRISGTTVSQERPATNGGNMDWWAGMLIKARDAQLFNQLKPIDGKLRVSAEDLGDTKLVEICFFIAHKETGNGLLAVYHNAPGWSLFRPLVKKLFNAHKEKRRTVETAGIKDRTVLKGYSGVLELKQLIREGTLKSLLKEFKRVQSTEIAFAVVNDNVAGPFSRLRQGAKSESVRFTFPPDFILDDETIDEMEKTSADPDDNTKIRVAGYDANNKSFSVSSDMARNKTIFAERDYDELMKGLSLDLDDWAPTIKASPIVNWLLEQTLHPKLQAKLLL